MKGKVSKWLIPVFCFLVISQLNSPIIMASKTTDDKTAKKKGKVDIKIEDAETKQTTKPLEEDYRATRYEEWDPFREMEILRNRMMRMFDDSIWRSWQEIPQAQRTRRSFYEPRTDVQERPEKIEVICNLPGMKKEDIHVTLDKNLLTIKGSVNEIDEEQREAEGLSYIMHERRTGTFERSLRIPGDINQNKVEAVYEDGVLKITIPKTKTKEKAPKKIEIR